MRTIIVAFAALNLTSGCAGTYADPSPGVCDLSESDPDCAADAAPTLNNGVIGFAFRSHLLNGEGMGAYLKGYGFGGDEDWSWNGNGSTTIVSDEGGETWEWFRMDPGLYLGLPGTDLATPSSDSREWAKIGPHFTDSVEHFVYNDGESSAFCILVEEGDKVDYHVYGQANGADCSGLNLQASIAPDPTTTTDDPTDPGTTDPTDPGTTGGTTGGTTDPGTTTTTTTDPGDDFTEFCVKFEGSWDRVDLWVRSYDDLRRVLDESFAATVTDYVGGWACTYVDIDGAEHLEFNASMNFGAATYWAAENQECESILVRATDVTLDGDSYGFVGLSWTMNEVPECDEGADLFLFL